MQFSRITLVAAAIAVTLPSAARAQDPMLGEIRWVAFNFAPKGWALCDGQILPISQNTALFSLLGTTYGGNGQTTFALPDFRGRTFVHQGQGPGLTNRVIGELGGTEVHTLTIPELPAHSHTFGDHSHSIPPLDVHIGASSAAATQATASGNVLAADTVGAGGNGNGNGGASKLTLTFNAGPADVSLGGGSVTAAGTTGISAGAATGLTGGGQPHSTMPPFLTGTCIIALEGIFPSRQ